MELMSAPQRVVELVDSCRSSVRTTSLRSRRFLPYIQTKLGIIVKIVVRMAHRIGVDILFTWITLFAKHQIHPNGDHG
jgi:hypothetical protein